jgi:hypothetical protein
MTGQVEELITAIKGLSEAELLELQATPEFALFLHKLYKLRPGDELTLERIEMDAHICREYPCSTDFYRAQSELARPRARFHSQRVIGSSPTGR